MLVVEVIIHKAYPRCLLAMVCMYYGIDCLNCYIFCTYSVSDHDIVLCLKQVDLHAGLVHFGLNQQCEPAQFIASFPTSDPGTVTISSAFFNLPLSALRATLGLDSETVQMLVDKVNSIQQVNPSFDQECLARCNITMPEFTEENVQVVTTHTHRPTTSQ